MSDTPFQAPSPEALAELLPQFAIDGFIAQGGMGAVYTGRQSSLDRDVAVKVLPRELGEDPEFRESFASEAKAMARLNHPNLIGVFDYGDVDGMPYIVMEYVQGCSLHESAYGQAVEPDQAVAIVKGICDGLAHAHEHGIVHRDIKPANILLTLKAEPKIGDFGLAHVADADTPGLVMGTPGFTAPEVFHDPNQAGPLADIYSVGMIFHQLLTGIDPTGTQEPPTQATGNIRLDAIWRKATKVHPSQRYASIAEMGEELEKWSTNKAGIAVPTGPANFQTGPRPGQPNTVTINSGGGGMGMFAKLAIAAVLVAVVVFTYQLLQEYKEDIKGGIAEANGHELGDPSDPMAIPDPKPDSSGGPTLPDGVELAPVGDPDPVEVASVGDPDPVEVGVMEDPDPGPVVAADPEDDPVEELEPGDPDLREKAVGLIDDAREQRDEKLAENVKALLFKLGVSKRGSGEDELDLIGQIEEDYEITKSVRVMEPEATRDFPDRIAEICREAHAKEEAIEELHRSALGQIRDAYVRRLETAAEEAADEDLKPRLVAQAERAEDVDEWVALLSPEPESSNPGSFTVRASGGFAGKWTITTDNVTHWHADEQGVVTIRSGPWEGKTATWKILDDGTLEIHWPDKPRPYVLSRDGDGWTGKTSFGKKASLVPGDW